MNILHLHEQQSIGKWKNSFARAVKEFYGIGKVLSEPTDDLLARARSVPLYSCTLYLQVRRVTKLI